MRLRLHDAPLEEALGTSPQCRGLALCPPRSRWPKTNPNATPPGTVEAILRLRRELSAAGLDAGPDTIAWHLGTHHQITVSTATISRQLTRAGLVTPAVLAVDADDES